MDTTNGTFVLATINGNYYGTYPFPRGGQGKFVNYSTVIGVCVPNSCSEEDMEKVTPTFMRMAYNANWTDVSVDYYFASRTNEEMKSQKGTGYVVMLALMGLFILLAIIGAVVELSQIGDIEIQSYEELQKA